MSIYTALPTHEWTLMHEALELKFTTHEDENLDTLYSIIDIDAIEAYMLLGRAYERIFDGPVRECEYETYETLLGAMESMESAHPSIETVKYAWKIRVFNR